MGHLVECFGKVHYNHISLVVPPKVVNGTWYKREELSFCGASGSEAMLMVIENVVRFQIFKNNMMFCAASRPRVEGVLWHSASSGLLLWWSLVLEQSSMIIDD